MLQATTDAPIRRSPTADELEAWRVFIESADALRTVLAARLQSESGLSSGDYGVLLALSEADNHTLRSSELAAHVGWERSRLSHHLGRMERRGLIRRNDCLTDNRGAEITLTDAGGAAFRKATAPHLHAIRELFVDVLTPEQLAAAREIGDRLQSQLVVTGECAPN